MSSCALSKNNPCGKSVCKEKCPTKKSCALSCEEKLEIIKDSNDKSFITIQEPKTYINRLDYILLAIINLFVLAIFFTSYIIGLDSTWYKNLVNDENVTWVLWTVRGAWVVATILAYIGFYYAAKHVYENNQYKIFNITILYIIGNLILVAWSSVLFQGQNLDLAVTIAAILFIFEYCLFLYIWSVNTIAGVFCIPFIFMYGYLFYSTIRLANLNQ